MPQRNELAAALHSVLDAYTGPIEVADRAIDILSRITITYCKEKKDA